MEDKAIGELWRRHDEPAHEYSCVEVRALIQKLVEERANKHYGNGVDWKEAVAMALRDFDLI